MRISLVVMDKLRTGVIQVVLLLVLCLQQAQADLTIEITRGNDQARAGCGRALCLERQGDIAGRYFWHYHK